ncbi:catenin alpha-2 isoform X1 [Dasypus novemcinctus]|uniref:catenin alpha-2 isoform X1 n=1 Tax=Dasypus novemcinctus TaxID=9361 RepID=UPI0039C921A7
MERTLVYNMKKTRKQIIAFFDVWGCACCVTQILLYPAVIVTTLVNTSNKGPSGKKKGRSKKAHVLAASVEQATQNFLEKGEQIAKESQDLKEELVAAVEDVRKQGETMRIASSEFADDPCSSVKRGTMVRAARALLSAVTRLLILADMADVMRLLSHLKIVEEALEAVKNATNEQDLANRFKEFGKEMVKLNYVAARRQQELKDPHCRDEMAAARGALKKNATMLYTASQAFLRHPDVAATRANRDYVFKQVQEAIAGISNAAQATSPTDEAKGHTGIGELAAALNEFDNKIILDPMTFSEARFRPSLEERLESIISGAALMADSSCTRDDRRERIVAECNAVRQALQDLLSEYMNNTGRKEKGDPLNIAIDKMTKKTRDLRRQLRKAVMDHISDSFLETNVPLLVLIEAAKSGNEKEVKEYAQVFREHANKLVEVANLACSISNNEEGVKLVRMAATQIDSLCPQVINAALTLAARPQSKVAQDNMDVFKDQWEKQVRVLTEAVDDITSVDDFLSVSENHILEDVNKCVIALQEGDVDTLDRTAGAIRGRAARVIHIINAEMENYEAGVYTEKVLEATKLLSETVMPRFAEQVEVAIEALSANVPQPFEENEFIDASRLVYDGVRDIRKAVLMIRTPEELEDDSDFEQEDYDVRSRTSVQTEDDQLIAGQSARAIMAQLPQEEKAKIAEQVEIFHQEKSKLDAEVAKWDDSGNDIIVLAKQMCMIMMEMTDFTRGKGPLKNTSDVINAAKKIAEAGSRMDKLARAVADQCPDSACKQDLLAYLQRIALYCHQLNICSKVKAEVQNLGGELIVSGTGVQSTFTTFYEVDCDVIDGGRASQLSTHLPTCAEGAPIGSGSSDSSMVYSQDSCIRLGEQRGSEEKTGYHIFAAALDTIYLKMESVLDSATSLIQAAKNLMNAVVLTVKASYVASTKYQKVYGTAAVNSPVVSWKMKAPEKKPLVKREKPEEFQTRVRRGSQKKHISPVQALSEFKAMDSF